MDLLIVLIVALAMACRWYAGRGVFWFRLWERGPGIWACDTRRHCPLYKHRTRGTRVGPYLFDLLWR